MQQTIAEQILKRSYSIVVIVIALAAAAVGQIPVYPPPPPQRPQMRAPERPVRVQYISGEASVAPKDTNEWTAARLNQQLTAGQYVWTGKDSRLEIATGDGFIRMNSEASATLIAVNRSTVQIGVNQGEVSVTIGRLAPGVIYEIDTPNATLTATKAGVYKVEVRPNEDQTIVATRKGSIVATGQGNAVKIDSGQQMVFKNKNSLQHIAMKAPPKDGFEDWASVRDQRFKANQPPFGVAVGFGPYLY
jgi:ferric-dicitrate binding protein FerR (iron transport regulator)